MLKLLNAIFVVNFHLKWRLPKHRLMQSDYNKTQGGAELCQAHAQIYFPSESELIF